jgi:hypothetical protein
VSFPHKVTHITAQKHATWDQMERLMAFSAFIIVRNPVGTVLAIHLLERTMKELSIEYE